MGLADPQTCRIADGGLGRIDIRVKIRVTGNMPDTVVAFAVDTEQAKQGKGRFKLKNQEVTGLKIL